MPASAAKKEYQRRWHAEKYASDPEYRARQQARTRAWNRQRALERPDEARAANRRNALKKYGITPEDYDRMLKEQGGCAICGATEPGGRGKNFHVDHCHSTGRVRGLLCHHCNVGIGMLRENFEDAAKYLKGDM